MIEAPQVTISERQSAAVIHIRCPRDQIREEVGPAIKEVLGEMARQRLSPQGPLFMHHLAMSSTHFDVEVGFPVNASFRTNGRVRGGELPAARVVRTIYSGPYEGLSAAWDEFGKHLERDRPVDRKLLSPITTLWERYLIGPETSDDPGQWRTELNLPLGKA